MSESLLMPSLSFWFIALLALWAGLLFGGFIFGKLDAKRERRMPAWTRMASSATLVVAAWNWWLVGRETMTATFTLLIAIGMTLGFLGDLFMAKLLPVGQHVLWGMGSFGLGHMAYIAGGLIFGNMHGLTAAGPRLGGWAVWLLVGLGGWFLAVFRGVHKPGLLHWAALPYALLLASTAGVATGLALQEARLLPLAVGAALFLLSDLILAARLFNDAHFYLINDVIWLTYGPGQMLIVYAISGIR
jgi:hypothetical protein